MSEARSTVIKLLLKMESSTSYSNILLNSAFDESRLSERDRAFAAVLFYGVTERKMTIDYIIDQYRTSKEELRPEVIAILRCGIYQLMYMPSVPDSAAVNESVKLCKKFKQFGAAGFVNALLRNFLRNKKAVDYSKLTQVERISIEYSCPQWIARKLSEEYGEQACVKALEASLGAPPIYARVNTTRTNEQDLVNMLKREGIKASVNLKLPGCINIEKAGDIEKSKAFSEGFFHIQDISSQLCCLTLKPVVNETVLDICAAPGGKSFTIAELMGNNGKVISMDLYEKRVKLIESGVERLGLKIIEPKLNNASKFNKDLPLADKVLCDVPCSGLGVIRRKPEIKYKEESEFKDLPILQKGILDISSKYVKPGGTLVYSTCTLSRTENDEVVAEFMKSHPEFAPIVQQIPYEGAENNFKRTFLPSREGSDGFFTASFRKIS